MTWKQISFYTYTWLNLWCQHCDILFYSEPGPSEAPATYTNLKTPQPLIQITPINYLKY